MIKKILISFCLFFSTLNLAQEGTSSPYSFYGIGDIKFKGAVENRSMGGVSVFNDSIHVNLQNPASFSHLKYSTFTVGGNQNFTTLETETESEKANRTTIDYLVVAIPVSKKFGAAVGLLPFSSVGYRIDNYNEDLTQQSFRYTGEGGVNRVFGGVGYKINEKLSIGADFNYNFGSIYTTAVRYIPTIQNGTREVNESSVQGVNFNLGMMYNRKISEKLTVFGSLTYAPESELTLTNQRNIATVVIGQDFIVIPQVSENIDVADSKLKMPSKFSVGLGIGEVQKWTVGSELTFQQSSNFGNRFDDITNVTYENSAKLAVGGYYIPNFNSFRSYFERVTYRGGFNYETTGMIINNKSIENYGITFGLGLPVGGSFSNINVGFEFGKRGTISNGLIEENYANISIGLSLNDRWFVKRKYE